MSYSTLRRGLAVLGAAGLLLAAAPAPARAAAAAELAIYMPDTTVAADTPGVVVWPILYGAEPVTLDGATVTYDFSGLAGVATMTDVEDDSVFCEPQSGDRLVCTDPFSLDVGPDGVTGAFPVVLAPVPGAAEGAEGALRVTFGADGVGEVTHEARVRVGEGVDLAGGEEATASGRPGGSFTAPLTVHNEGETTVEGAVAVFGHDYGIIGGVRHGNCTYRDDELTSCRFDQPLSPATTYTATLSYALRPDVMAPGAEYGDVLWLTPAEFDDLRALLEHRGIPLGAPGTADPLALTEDDPPVDSRADRVQADVDPDDNWSSLRVDVQGSNGADLAAVGDTARGARGARVTVSVGMTNLGPATLDAGRSGEPLTQIDVRVPPGTTAVEVPDACHPFDGENSTGDPGEPGAPAYRCESSIFIRVGETQTVDFGLRVDRVIANAAGSVRVNGPCECSGWRGDTNPRNDTAKIVINPVAAPGGGAGGAAGGAGGGEEEEGLPITGSSTTTLVVVGLLLVVGGAVVVLAGRRRRG